MNNYLRVRVTYTDGHEESGSKSLQREATNRVRAAQGNNNFGHCSRTLTTTRTVQENTSSRESRIGDTNSGHRRGQRPADLLFGCCRR